MAVFRYSRWDGSQDVVTPNKDSLMDQLSDELMSNGDVTSALRNIVRQGLNEPEGKTRGVQEMLEQLRKRRQEALDRYNLSSVLDDIQNKLQSVLRHEEEGIEKQFQRARSMKQQAEGAQGDALDPQTREKLLGDMERRARASREALRQVPRDNMAEAIKKLRNYEFTNAQAKQEFDDLLKMLQQQAAESLFNDLSKSLRDMSSRQVQSLK